MRGDGGWVDRGWVDGEMGRFAGRGHFLGGVWCWDIKAGSGYLKRGPGCKDA